MKKDLLKKIIFCATVALSLMLPQLNYATTMENVSGKITNPKFEKTTASTGLLKIDENWYENNDFTRRDEAIQKYGIYSNITIGWYVGVVDSFDMRDLLERFLPLSNFLTNKLNKLVVLVTDKEASLITKDALDGNFDIVYNSAIDSVQLRNTGWQAVVGRSDPIIGVILVRADSRINKIEDAKNAKIMAPLGAVVTSFMKYKLFEKNMLNKLQFAEVRLNQTDLLQVVDSKQIDGIVVRDSLAKNLIMKNPGKYKIGFTADTSPGHAIFASPKMSEEKIRLIRNALTGLNLDNGADSLRILKGLDGYKVTDKRPFIERKNEDFELTAKIFDTLKKLPMLTEIDQTK